MKPVNLVVSQGEPSSAGGSTNHENVAANDDSDCQFLFEVDNSITNLGRVIKKRRHKRHRTEAHQAGQPQAEVIAVPQAEAKVVAGPSGVRCVPRRIVANMVDAQVQAYLPVQFDVAVQTNLAPPTANVAIQVENRVPEVTCRVCLDTFSDRLDSDAAGNPQEKQFWALACGHIYCKPCLSHLKNTFPRICSTCQKGFAICKATRLFI